MDYSAGTVFLEVAPSFDGLQDETRRQVKKAFGGVEAEAKRSFDKVEREIAKAGEKGAEEYGSAFERMFKKRLGPIQESIRGLKGLVPEDTFKQIRQDLEALGKIDLRSVAGQAQARQEAEQLRRTVNGLMNDMQAAGRRGPALWNLGALREELNAVDKVIQRWQGSDPRRNQADVALQARAIRENAAIDEALAAARADRAKQEAIEREKMARDARALELAELRRGIEQRARLENELRAEMDKIHRQQEKDALARRRRELSEQRAAAKATEADRLRQIRAAAVAREAAEEKARKAELASLKSAIQRRAALEADLQKEIGKIHKQQEKDALAAYKRRLAEEEAAKKASVKAAAEYERDLYRAHAENDRRDQNLGVLQSRAIRENVEFDIKIKRDAVAREKAAIQAEFRGLQADIKLGVTGGAQAEARIASLRSRLNALDRMNVDPDIDVDVSRDLVALRMLEAQLNRTERSSRGLGRALSALAATAGAANAVRIFSGALLMITTVGPMVIPLLAGITAGIFGLGGAALAVMGGLGVLVAGLSGIGGAVKAMNDLAKARRTADAGGANQRSAAADARRAVQDARAVADAQRDLARARRDAARSINDSAQRVRDAERGVAAAQRDSVAAQRALNVERAQAVRDLEDMNNQLATARLNERAGELAVEEALVHLNVVLEDEQATEREKEVARLQYEQAVQRLKEQRTETKRLEEDTAKANKAGVEGSERVLNAKAAIVDAAEREREAERALADAREDFAREQVQAAERVADAEENLRRTYQDVAMRGEEAALATNELTTETNKLAEAMRNLSPAGQAFATWLFGLKPLLDEIRFAAQEGFLPGLQAGLQTIIDTYGPDFVDFVGDVAEALGDVAEMSAEMFTNPFWQEFFGYIASIAPDVIRDLSQVGLNLLTVFAGLLKAFAPLNELIIEGLLEMTAGWAEWAQGLEENEAFQEFMDYVMEAWPKVSELLGNLFELLLKVIIALEPYADRLLDIFIAVTDWLLNMDEDTFGALVTGVFAFIAGIQIAAGLIAVIGGIAGLVASQVGLVVAAIVALVGVFGWLWNENEAFRQGVEDAWAAIEAAVKPIAEWFVLEGIPAWQDFWDNIRGGLNGTAEDPTWNTLGEALEAFKTGWELAEDAAVVAGDSIKWVLENVLTPAFQIWWTITEPILSMFGGMFDVAWQIISRVVNMISQLFTHVFVPIFRNFWAEVEPLIKGFQVIWETNVAPAIQAFIDWLGPAWNGILDLFRAPIRGVIDLVINKGLIGAFNWIADRVPGMTRVEPVRIPDALQPGGVAPGRSGAGGSFADGTDAMMLPGYTPGRDVHRFVSPTGGVLDLSGGEAVLVPELARALGRDWVLGANKAARRGQGLENYLGGFAGGGFIDNLGDTWDRIMNGASATWGSFTKAITDPARFLREVVEEGMKRAVPGLKGPLADASSAVATAPISAMQKAIQSLFSGGDDPVGKAGSKGGWTGGGMGWKAMWEIVRGRFPGARLHSAYRPGSITALGTPSMHGAGRAIDITPSIEIFNFLREAFGATSKELIFSPAGGRQIYKGKNYFYPEPTRGDHWDHIHWGYSKGGIIPKLYDQGGDVPPGLTLVANKTGKPESLVTNRFVEEVRDNLNRGGDFIVDQRNSTFGSDPSEVADAVRTGRRDELALAGLDQDPGVF